MKNSSKIKGCLLGGAIGDALGYEIKKTGQRKFGQHNSKGAISDNTQMSLFTANALIYEFTNYNVGQAERTIEETIYLSYLDWLQTQTAKENIKKISWIRDIPELNVCKNTNNSCINILNSGLKGSVANPVNNNNESIAITRIVPIGLYLKTNEEVGWIATSASAITHGHPLVIISSYVLSVLIHILSTTNKTIKDALVDAVYIFNKLNIYDQGIKEYFNILINKTINLSEQNLSDIDAINQLGEGWKSEESFAIALYSCLKYSNSFNDAITCATNHSGNSSATGTIAGNIIGTFLGYRKIPRNFIKNLEIKDEIIEIANDLSRDCINKNGSKLNNNWINKYINVKVDINKNRRYQKQRKIVFLVVYGLLLLIMFILATSYYVRYFKSFNVPIEINDDGITELINHDNTSNILLLLSSTITIFPIIVILYKKLKENRGKDKMYLIIGMILFSFMLFISFVYLFIKPVRRIEYNDWRISIENIEKKQRGGRKSQHCYVYLKGISDRKRVDCFEYKVYLDENDDVYTIYDMKNNNTTVLSPKHYKYVGDKLNGLTINISNGNINHGYFLFLAIVFTIVSALLLLLLFFLIL